jgi:outer membrane lipase/esterase
MRQNNFALALLVAASVAACGGSTGGDQTLKVKYASQVSFGDSLSDVGTYQVGTVKALGGGTFTINGDNTKVEPTLTGKNWTQLTAAQFGLPAPCPAQTGLEGDAASGFAVPVVKNPGCFGYAQGGSRVSNPIGPSNKATGSPIGATTVPVTTQVANHLALNGGKFKGDEIVFVMAGGNDALALLTGLSTAATAAGVAEGTRVGNQTFVSTFATLLGSSATSPASAIPAIGAAMVAESQRAGSTTNSLILAGVTAAAQQPGNAAVASQAVWGPLAVQAKASADAAGQTAGAKAGADYAAANGPKLVNDMAVAATELANLVKTQIVGKGATHVVVNNLPDLGGSPAGRSKDASTLALINAMVKSFNETLRAGVANNEAILYVDLFAISQDQQLNPKAYGLTNTTTPACGPNKLGTTSLVCNATNVIAGDVSHYMFADDVHPTPFVHMLIARYVSEQMVVRHWL